MVAAVLAKCPAPWPTAVSWLVHNQRVIPEDHSLISKDLANLLLFVVAIPVPIAPTTSTSYWLRVLTPFALCTRGATWEGTLSCVPTETLGSAPYLLSLLAHAKASSASLPLGSLHACYDVLVRRVIVHMFKNRMHSGMALCLENHLMCRLSTQWSFTCALLTRSPIPPALSRKLLLQVTELGLWHAGLAVAAHTPKGSLEIRTARTCREHIASALVLRTPHSRWADALTQLAAAFEKGRGKSLPAYVWSWFLEAVPCHHAFFAMLHTLLPLDAQPLRSGITLRRLLASPSLWAVALPHVVRHAPLSCDVVMAVLLRHPRYAVDALLPLMASALPHDLDRIVEVLAKQSSTGHFPSLWQDTLRLSLHDFPTRFPYVCNTDLRQVLHAMAKRLNLPHICNAIFHPNAKTQQIQWSSAVSSLTEILLSKSAHRHVDAACQRLLEAPHVPITIAYHAVLAALHATRRLAPEVLSRLIFDTLETEDPSQLATCLEIVRAMARSYVDHTTKDHIMSLLTLLRRKMDIPTLLEEEQRSGTLLPARKTKSRYVHSHVFIHLASLFETTVLRELPLLKNDVSMEMRARIDIEVIATNPALYALHDITNKDIIHVLCGYASKVPGRTGSKEHARDVRSSLRKAALAVRTTPKDVVTLLVKSVIPRRVEWTTALEVVACHAQNKGSVDWRVALRHVFHGDTARWRRAVSCANITLR